MDEDRLPAELLSERVRERARESVAALDAAGVERERSRVDARLERLFALSPYLMETCRRYPEALVDLVREEAFSRAGPALDTLVAELERARAARAPALAENPEAKVPEAAELAALRVVRHRHMLRILWREIEREATLDDTLGDLTRLAEACIGTATAWAEARERRRSGVVHDADGREQRLIVLGMGKLGGGELNVSSDVDLILLYPTAGASDGRRRIDASEHFARVARQLARLLGAVTADGFAFRVDTRLRPFGESGPPALSLDALEHYLLTQGRDWERYAMIKARALTGDAEDVARLGELLRPFVYRRYLDYDAIVSLAELKAKIRLSVSRRDGDADVKLGRGGIREVEFTAQALQLVRGGRETRLQRRGLREVLGVAASLGLMPGAEARALVAAYEYLRRVENALQGMRDEQTHRLPDGAEDRARLVAILGEEGWESFLARLERERDTVERCFLAVFGDDPEAAGADGASAEGTAPATPPPVDAAAAARFVEAFGIEPEEALLERLVALAAGPFHRRLTARAQRRVERILAPLAQEALGCEQPAAALARALDFVRAVAGRSGYLQALLDHRAALARLTRLFGASAWVAAHATRHPIVVDELIGQSSAMLFADAATVRDQARAEAGRLAGADLERQMDALRQFRQARELRVAAAALEGELTPMQVSDRLSWLAEALVDAVLELVGAEDEGCGQGIGVIAYGKLGGLELGFGSDLDLVFLHDGSRPEAEAARARLLRRFVHFMTAPTPAGTLYAIDLRLRPNGAAGVPVTSLERFERYQREEAWTWETQALLRARAVAGDAALGERFESLRRAVLCLPREGGELAREVRAMRERMRAELGSGREDAMELKQDAGGIADIEFIVQYLALAHAAEHPALVRFSDNVRVLEAVGEAGLLPLDTARALAEDYVELRARLHRRVLAGEDSTVPLDGPLLALRERVVALRRQVLDEENGDGDRPRGGSPR